MNEPETDGRRQRGARRRQALIDATLRVIERSGVPAITQRAVATEAGVQAGLITYYFPTTDDLVTTALTSVNDRYLALLDACAAAPDAIDALVEALRPGPDIGPGTLAAEYELFMLAVRRPDLLHEYTRWTDALDRIAGRLTDDQTRHAGLTVAIEGLFLRCYFQPDGPVAAEAEAVLRRLAGLTD